jgi:3-oxosteroid 1-dehydrogenase
MEEFVPIRPARSEPVAGRQSARPSRDAAFDVEVDVVVVGGGPGGLATAIFCRWLGEDVLLLEKAPELGGTGVKAAFLCWAPNNRWLREAGIDDPEEDFLRFAARTARPEKYDPNSETFGQSPWEFAAYQAIYKSARVAVELLHDRGALRFQHELVHGEYWPNLSENLVKGGRGLFPEGVNETRTNGGQIAMDSLARAAEEAGVDIRTGWRAQRLIMDGDRVVGVEATTADGQTLAAGGREGVVFATGGFTHDQELVENYLNHPNWGGGAARTNEGDFIRIATPAGAQLRNMQHAWRGPVSLFKVLRRDPAMQCTFLRAGDSMICVNTRGERVLNEKLPYNEFVAAMFDWDARRCEFPNRLLIQLWDQHTQDHSAAPNDFMGSAVLPADQQDEQNITADTLDGLASAIADRLNEYAPYTGNAALADDFLLTLRATIERFNAFARTGVDEDFHRGEREVERTMFGGLLADEPGKRNPVLYPVAPEGPYYATLLVAGTLDTKGGPKVDVDGRVVDDQDRPIPGLFGIGNCVASASASAYWAAGGTLGPIFGFAHRAAEALHAVLPAGEREQVTP